MIPTEEVVPQAMHLLRTYPWSIPVNCSSVGGGHSQIKHRCTGLLVSCCLCSLGFTWESSRAERCPYTGSPPSHSRREAGEHSGSQGT